MEMIFLSFPYLRSVYQKKDLFVSRNGTIIIYHMILNLAIMEAKMLAVRVYRLVWMILKMERVFLHWISFTR